MNSDKYDVIIIGAGIGGLTAGAILARNGKKVLILEKNHIVGGYAANFKRKGFNFESSLHLINGGKRGSVHGILEKCGIDSKINFLAPKFLFHSIFPDFDIKIPQCSLSELVERLVVYFPTEKENINRLMKSVSEFALEVEQFRKSVIDETQSRSLPFGYKDSSYYLNKSWGNIVDKFLSKNELKAIFSQLWPFFGLSPKSLSAYYFSASLFDYIINGGHYIEGGSGSLASALSDIIKGSNGEILLNSKVDEIILHNKKAIGVKIISGEEFLCKYIISNIDPINTFFKLLPKEKLPQEFLTNLKKMKHSISAFEVHLGLNVDLSKHDSLSSEYELFINPSYDFDEQYLACLANNMNHVPLSVTFYSNLEKNLAPNKKSYLSITTLAGYDFWTGSLDKEYLDRKELFADILIKRVQKFIPDLASHIEVKDIATPLTMERYTGNYKGAVFGWEQNVSQAGINRTDNFTPINNVYLVGAWTRPGAGIVGVLQSGERVAEYIVSTKK